MQTVELPHVAVDPYSTEVLTDPLPFWEEVREAGPVVRVDQSLGYDIVAVGRDAELRELHVRNDLFISGRGAGILDRTKGESFREPAILLESDQPDHTAVRSVIGEILAPRNLRRLRQTFAEAADTIVDLALEKGLADAQTDLAEAFPLRVIPDAVIGAPPEGRENLLRYSTFLFESLGPQTERARAEIAAVGDLAAVQEWIRASCARDAVARGTVGGAIWEAADAGKFTPDQAANLVRSLLGAGIDTTIHSIAYTLFHLATHPGEYAKLVADPRRAKFAYEESLRLDSVVRQNYRTPARDTEIGGIPIREGQKVMLLVASANRDPRRWGPTVDRYDIDRTSEDGHMTFGRGIHQCIGQPIARMEAEALIGAVARKVATIELTGEPVPMLNNTLRGFRSLPVRLTAA
ncbi:cytochrome P450 [Actinomycetospora termitidis]|uniref:Cytochrome P450 n=1 Tax=Actinomycetospora termitidis TaxID=3053470 RepID=A0ABT7M640_9PSEU|nr:cytochrome P450 [Actinomycetospora sp. Odt1-22]MDL5156129.1 cytochrome P450 [Actinomycetospora sp. Odt1-22]